MPGIRLMRAIAPRTTIVNASRKPTQRAATRHPGHHDVVGRPPTEWDRTSPSPDGFETVGERVRRARERLAASQFGRRDGSTQGGEQFLSLVGFDGWAASVVESVEGFSEFAAQFGERRGNHAVA